MSQVAQVDDKVRQAIVEAIRWAPSADNSQPWLCQWRRDVLNLSIDLTRSGGISDTRFLLSDLALGAATEAAVLRACAFGFATRVQLLPQPEDHPEWTSALSFVKTHDAQEMDRRLASALTNRRTCRALRLRGPIPAEVWQALHSAIDSLRGVSLIRLEGDQRRRALRALGMAEAMRFSDERYHAELMSSIRFDKGLSDEVEEGIGPGSLGLGHFEWMGLKVMRHWPVMSFLNKLGGARMIAFRSAELPARLAPGLSALTISNSDRASILSGGRALLRVWLQAAALGLVLQPFAAPGVMSLGLAPRPDIPARFCDNFVTMARQITGEKSLLLILRFGRRPRPIRDKCRHSARRHV